MSVLVHQRCSSNSRLRVPFSSCAFSSTNPIHCLVLSSYTRAGLPAALRSSVASLLLSHRTPTPPLPVSPRSLHGSRSNPMIPSNCGASMLLDVRYHLFISPLPASLAILPSPWNTTPPPPLQNPKPSRQHRCIWCFSAKRSGSSWDSNAESVRAGRFRFQGDADRGRRREKRKWWSDEDGNEDEDNESSDDEEDSDAFGEQLWDTFWIFKVFRSYGWMLPAIIISMLLATGPKAFLMALALPLGQSVLSLAVDKVWAGRQDRPKRKSRNKKKNQENREGTGGGQRWGYKTWTTTDDGLIDKDNSWRPSSFGGWDELDRPGETENKVRGEQEGRTIKRSSQPRPQKGKLTRRMKNSDAPLLLRLLIAIFPFLGSWTRIL